jgi:RsiW-degrading membrane proteinase PrsW (M82 family)
MRNGRAGWFVAIAFWCGFALLVAAGRDADVWVRAVIWTGLALLFVATLRWWRPGLTVHSFTRVVGLLCARGLRKAPGSARADP